MTDRALGKLTDGLKQALDEAQISQTKQLEQFMKIQTQDLKLIVQDSVAKGAQEVFEKLQPPFEMIHKEVSKHSLQAHSVSIL